MEKAQKKPDLNFGYTYEEVEQQFSFGGKKYGSLLVGDYDF